MWSLSGMGLAVNLDGRLELMAVATRPVEPGVDVGELTSLWRRWERVELEGGWSGWESFGPVINTASPLAQTPAVARDEHGCLWAVVKGHPGVWAVAQRHPGRGWHGWIELGQPVSADGLTGGLTGSVVLGTNSDGPEVFAADADGDVWHRQAAAEDQWHELGRPAAGPADLRLAVAPNKDGRLELFATAEGFAAVWHCWQRHQGGWSPWKLLGTPAKHVVTSAPVAAQNKDGRLEVFIIAGDHGVWHCQQRPEGGWSPLAPMDQAGATPTGILEVAAGAHADGRLMLFATVLQVAPAAAGAEHATSTRLLRREQTTPGGNWSDWDDSFPSDGHGGLLVLHSLALALNADGQLELFAAIKDSTGLYRFRQSSPSGSDWVSQHGDIALPPPPPAPALNGARPSMTAPPRP
jgi:hypothetical protein